jgi:cytidylate kinase
MTKFESPPMAFTVVAIDGGAASGKSSTARLLAERLSFLHVDTGTHYRSMARACLDAGLHPVDSFELRAFLAAMRLDTVIDGYQSRLAINGSPPFADQRIRSEDVNRNVSQFAALPAVRESIKRYQQSQVRRAASDGFRGLVMEGRDIGTVILPEADLKIFLTADAATRQSRRHLEGGVDRVEDRDKIDSSRATAPLRPAHDAVCIDNSTLSLEEVVERVTGLILEGPCRPR